VLPPPKDVQPLLPARLHNKPLSHTHTMDSIKLGVNTSPFNVKRSSSMSQVLPPPHGSMSKVGVILCPRWVFILCLRWLSYLVSCVHFHAYRANSQRDFS